MQTQKTPMIGESVFIPFVTGLINKPSEPEKVGYIKGAALSPFDKIDAVYVEKSYSQSGKPVYNVRVKSGDKVSIMLKDDKWQAIA